MEIQPCLGYIQVGDCWRIFLDIFLYFLAQLLVLAVSAALYFRGYSIILPLLRKICP